jgi:4-carboxymuconolactone decarboxylase
MANEPSPRDAIRDFAPKLVELTEGVLFGDVWERPQLSKRDRSLIVVATLIALGKERQMVGHLNRALDNGLSVEEIKEVITHLAFYSGWPTAMTAATIFKEVLEKRGS